MEIKVNIPKNDYKEPTEVRQDVVQCICEHIISRFSREDSASISVWDSNYHTAELWYGKSKGAYGSYILFADRQDKKGEYTRVRGCEMQAVFDAMIAAGYFISGSYNITDQKQTYLFTYKPDKYDHLVTKFTYFID